MSEVKDLFIEQPFDDVYKKKRHIPKNEETEEIKKLTHIRISSTQRQLELLYEYISDICNKFQYEPVLHREIYVMVSCMLGSMYHMQKAFYVDKKEKKKKIREIDKAIFLLLEAKNIIGIWFDNSQKSDHQLLIRHKQMRHIIEEFASIMSFSEKWKSSLKDGHVPKGTKILREDS